MFLLLLLINPLLVHFGASASVGRPFTIVGRHMREVRQKKKKPASDIL